MKKKISWILVFFMLFASLWQAARMKEVSACAPGRQEAEREWRLTGRLASNTKTDCREASRYQNVPGRGSAVTGSGLRTARGLQNLLGLMVICFLALAGKKECRGCCPAYREPVRMRAVRHIHFAYGL